MSTDEEYLSTWFINTYIRQCAQLCPVYILRLFHDVSSSVKLLNAVSEIVRWRLNTSLLDLLTALYNSERTITHVVSLHSLDERSCVYWMNELVKVDKRLSDYIPRQPIYCQNPLLADSITYKFAHSDVDKPCLPRGGHRELCRIGLICFLSGLWMS